MTDMICVGVISGAFGVSGEARIKSFTADPAAIEEYSPLHTSDGREITVRIVRQLKNGMAARLSDVRSKEDADALNGTQLFVARDRLPSLPDDEYYHTDLIGLEVCDTGGNTLGHVKSVMNNGAGDLLEIHGPELKATVLIPFTMAVVPTVDLTAGRIIADPPEGLF
ncbi:MAG: ribosome maturation factor RimM [Paracoccaceae bacterium]